MCGTCHVEPASGTAARQTLDACAAGAPGRVAVAVECDAQTLDLVCAASEALLRVQKALSQRTNLPQLPPGMMSPPTEATADADTTADADGSSPKGRPGLAGAARRGQVAGPPRWAQGARRLFRILAVM